MTRFFRSTALAALAALTTSCSFFISGPDPESHPEYPPACTTSRIAPAVDTVGATSFGLLSALLAAAVFTFECDSRNADCHDNEGAGVLLVGAIATPALIYGGAAVSGFSKTSRCRQAMEEHRRWLDLQTPRRR